MIQDCSYKNEVVEIILGISIISLIIFLPGRKLKRR
jgi:hypothetical protein